MDLTNNYFCFLEEILENIWFCLVPPLNRKTICPVSKVFTSTWQFSTLNSFFPGTDMLPES